MIPQEIIFYYDSKEKYPHISYLISSGYKVVETSLKVGDYLITNGIKEIIIEVKNDVDLLSSKITGRLQAQIHELSRHEWSILAVIGDIDKKFQEILIELKDNPEDPRWKWAKIIAKNYPKSISSIKTSAAFKKPRGTHRVAYIPYENSTEFQRGMIYLSEQLENDTLYYETDLTPSDMRHIREKTADSVKSSKILMMSRIEKIGLKKAIRILEYFNYNLAKISTATTEQLQEVRGVKDVIANNIRKVFKDEDSTKIEELRSLDDETVVLEL